MSMGSRYIAAAWNGWHITDMGIGYLKNNYCNTLADRYNINIDKENFEILSDIAIIRKCLKKGNEPDLDKAANLLLEDFRSGKLGRISLEKPQ